MLNRLLTCRMTWGGPSACSESTRRDFKCCDNSRRTLTGPPPAPSQKNSASDRSPRFDTFAHSKMTVLLYRTQTTEPVHEFSTTLIYASLPCSSTTYAFTPCHPRADQKCPRRVSPISEMLAIRIQT